MIATTQRPGPAQAATSLRRGDFRRLLRQGRRVEGTLVSVAVLPRGDGALGVGVITGRRLGGAVDRNRARRVIKEALRSVMDRARAGADVAVVAEPGIAGARSQDVAEELEVLLARAGVIDR